VGGSCAKPEYSKPHFSNPNGNVNSGNFGKVLSTQTAYATGRSREFRFGLRFSF
jgi:hypothetical protein